MKKRSIIALLVSITVFSFLVPNTQKILVFPVPKSWPQAQYDFSKNPLTEEGFELGRSLFFDPILSKDNSISCASCHLSFTAFTHADHRVSHGIYGRIGTRNSLTLMNLAWSKNFMWDGGVNNLEVQAINPITNALEMDNTLDNVTKKLNQSHLYRLKFYAAFNDSLIDSKKLLKALAQFTVLLTSSNSKYDSVMRKDKNVAFTPSENRGYRVFKQNCSSCHTEPFFTNQSFQNNGLPLDTALNDYGRYGITKNPADSFKFKVPSLRNIEYSAPYFHDGRVNKLRDVFHHYAFGIKHSSTLAQELRTGIVLSKEDQKDLLLFLKTLTDKAFLYNERFRYKSN